MAHLHKKDESVVMEFEFQLEEFEIQLEDIGLEMVPIVFLLLRS